MTLSAVVVNWNGARFLPRCLESLAGQSASARVVVVDNASDDGSAEYIQRYHPGIELIALEENRGYAGGANVGIRAAATEYVMVMNPDVVLAPDHFEKLAHRLDSEPHIGAAQGKLLQVRPAAYDAGDFDPGAPLDSAGHRAARTRMVYDRGQGEAGDGRYEREESVFSACGAALLLRRTMLDDIAADGEFFDESFFAYKEDIDLCWRARLLGWDVRYVPAAVAWHVRGWAGGTPPAAQGMSPEARLHSFKNHYLLLLKNAELRDLLRHLPAVLSWELLRQGHALLRDRSLYRTYPALWRLLPEMLRKRRDVMRRRRVPRGALARWFGR